MNKEEVTPEQWKNSVICSIPKKGDITLCENHREIALLDVVYKILAIKTIKRLKIYENEIVAEYQEGFIEGRSTRRRLIESLGILGIPNNLIKLVVLELLFKPLQTL